jgi:hypothetical protein
VASYYTHIISVKDRNLITRSDPRCCPGTALTLPADAPSRREPLVKLIKINMAGGHEQPRRNQVLNWARSQTMIRQLPLRVSWRFHDHYPSRGDWLPDCPHVVTSKILAA